MRVIWQAETDPYASRVLAKHWPQVPNLGDVTMIDWSTVERPDLLCGGFPCQPVSLAGQRRGQDDERWLWPEYARAIRHLRPGHVLVENVPGLLVRGVGDVLGELATLGYDTEWESIPAAAVGAPHLRWRVFILAHAHGDRVRQQPVSEPGSEGQAVAVLDRPVADTGGPGWQGNGLRGSASERRADVAHPESVTVGTGLRPGESGGERRGRPGDSGCPDDVADAQSIERQAVPARVPPRRSDWWAVEPDVGRVADGIPARVDRLRGLGNAVVPQVAEFIGAELLRALANERRAS